MHNQVGHGAGKRRKKSGGEMGSVPWVVPGRKRGSHTQRGLLTARGSAGREGEGFWRSCGDQSRTWKVAPPDCSGPSETARVLGLSLTPVWCWVRKLTQRPRTWPALLSQGLYQHHAWCWRCHIECLPLAQYHISFYREIIVTLTSLLQKVFLWLW